MMTPFDGPAKDYTAGATSGIGPHRSRRFRSPASCNLQRHEAHRNVLLRDRPLDAGPNTWTVRGPDAKGMRMYESSGGSKGVNNRNWKKDCVDRGGLLLASVTATDTLRGAAGNAVGKTVKDEIVRKTAKDERVPRP